MSKTLRFRLRTLMGEYSDRTGTRLTYADITAATGIGHSTLSHIAQNKVRLISASTIERLCDFFGCDLCELMALEEDHGQDSQAS